MNNTRFVSRLIGQKSTASPKLSAFVEALVREEVARPGVYRKGEIERYLGDLRRAETLVKKHGEPDHVPEPKLKKGYVKRTSSAVGTDAEIARGILERLRDALKESVQQRAPSGRMVQLRESCVLDARGMCGCKQCLGNH